LTQATVTPSDGSTITDSHSPINATYTDNGAAANLDSSSTITVTKGGTTPTSIGCSSVVSGNMISCSHSGLLAAGTYSVAIHAVEAANTAKTSDKTTTFTVNVPTRTGASPAANATVATLPSGMITATFDQAIDDAHSTISVQQVADRNADDSFTPASHTPLTGQTSFTPQNMLVPSGDANTSTTIQFKPDDSTPSYGIYQVTLDVFGVTAPSGQNAPATYNPTAETKDVYTFTLDNTPPAGATDLAVSPTPVTNVNKTTVTFSGKAKPGNTITVTATHAASSKASPATPVPSDNCASTTSCQWSVTLDLTSVTDGTVTWTAKETSSVGSTTVSGPSFLKDTTAPASPAIHASFPTSPTILHLTGGSDSTVDHYTIDIRDSTTPTNKTIPQITLDKSADGGVAADGTFTKDVDVSSLNDGTLNMNMAAYDAYGNSSLTFTGIAKDSGLQLVFGSSFFKLVNSDTPSFPEVLARSNHAVQKPAQLAIEFSNPITLVRQDTSTLNNTPDRNSGGHDLNADAPTFTEVLPNGDGNTFVGTASTDSDSRRLLVTPPAGLADGTYKVHVTLWEVNKCDWTDSTTANPTPNYNPAPCDAKYTYNDYVMTPGTSTPFTFTVDTAPPTAATITDPAGTVDGTTAGDIVIKGTGEAGTLMTLLSAKSNSASTPFVLNGGNAVTIDDQGKWQDDEGTAVANALPDGTITVTGTPADSAGNTGSAVTHTFVLAARPSTPRALAVSVTDTAFTLHWVAPAYDGYPAVNGNAISHLTGYAYTYKDTTAGAADPSSHTSTVNNPSATTLTQSGLLPGHTYAISLCALNGIGDAQCNVIKTNATPAFRTTLTAHVSKALVVYGSPITLSGRLTRTDIGAGITSQALNITPLYETHKTGSVIHVTTNSLGNWAVTISKPAKDALYLVSYNSPVTNATYQPSNSSVRSLVEVALSTPRVTSRSSSHTSPVTIYGSILPNQSGRYVYIYARAAGATHYARIGAAKVTSRSTWALAKTFGRGKFYVYAVFANQNGNVGAATKSVSFTRT
jgi:hypothetical protein